MKAMGGSGKTYLIWGYRRDDLLQQGAVQEGRHSGSVATKLGTNCLLPAASSSRSCLV